MIIFDLQCPGGHQFEGWFSDNDDFDRQQASGLLSCPVCGQQQVEKRLSGGKPLLKSKAIEKKQRQQQTAKSSTKEKKPKEIQVDPVVILKALKNHVQKNFTDVGAKFYEEAVAMHEGEKPKRNIYGEVTPEEREKLEEKNIDYMMLPKLGPEFEN